MKPQGHPGLWLFPGKEKPIRNYHHWIFSGAVMNIDEDAKDGEIVPVYTSKGEWIASAYLNRASKIIARIVAFGTKDAKAQIHENIVAATRWRETLFSDGMTTAYRVINAEGDGLPGLIVDRYDNTLVVQIATLGMERQKGSMVEMMRTLYDPACIYEKSNLPVRREENLPNTEGVLHGILPKELVIRENNLRFAVDIEGGQKTGFFLDQREMRSLVETYAADRTVLNCFSYTGGFSLYALRGGAAHVTSVDVSDNAIHLANHHAALNAFSSHTGVVADVFSYLRSLHKGENNFIILDPPAFAKRRADIVPACRGYKDINRLALSSLPKNGLLLTASCSQAITEDLFQTVVFQAAREANRRVRIISRHRLAADHPINIYHPEGEYLKGLLLQVD